MATIRAIQGDWSFSQSFKSYFNCCLGGQSSRDGSTKEEIITRDAVVDSDIDKDTLANGDAKRKVSYGSVRSSKSLSSHKSGSTSLRSRGLGDGAELENIHCELKEGNNESNSVERAEVVHIVSSKENEGSAYVYEEQDTSSDSDDEVLRRYQQSIQRVPSQRSLHSTRSQKSSASKLSKSGHQPTGSHDNIADQHDHLMSLAEKGDGTLSTSTHSAAGSTKASTSGRPVDVTAVVGDRQEGATTPGGSTSKQVIYENEAFDKEQQEVSPGQVSPTSTEQALSNFEDGSVSIGDEGPIHSTLLKEHLFDVSDLQDREPVFISKCGNLEVTFEYDTSATRMNITIHKATDIPSKDRGGANNTQVRILLLPTKKIKHKTKVKQGENPEFMETFGIKVPLEEVASMGVRFRLYGCERMRRERMIGEVIFGFASLSLDVATTHTLTMEPRSNLSHGDSKMDVSSLSRSDSASSTQSMQHGGMPELLIGLTYNGTTGRLSVEVIKGSNFKNMAMNRAPDTYVKLTLMSPNGQEIARSKTSLRRGQPNPLYKETFMFQVALFQLPDVTLMTSVYNKRSMKRKEMIGWFSLGYSSSGEEEVSHWNDMRETKGEPVCRWHVLLEA